MFLYIDDERIPTTKKNWNIVRSSEEAIKFISINGCPNYISFDHDLGGEDTAMIVVKWLVETDMDNNGTFIPKDFQYNVHSANPTGADNIESYLKSYFKQKN